MKWDRGYRYDLAGEQAETLPLAGTVVLVGVPSPDMRLLVYRVGYSEAPPAGELEPAAG